MSITLCLPVSLTLLIFTLIPSLEKLINSGRIPTCVLLKFIFLMLVLLGNIFPSKLIYPFLISQGRIFIPGDPIKCPTNVCFGFSNNSTGVPV